VDKRKTHRNETKRWKVGNTLEFQSLDQGEDAYFDSAPPENNETDTECEKNKIFVRRPKAKQSPHS